MGENNAVVKKQSRSFKIGTTYKSFHENFIQIGFWLTFKLVIIKDHKQNTIVIFNILLLNSIVYEGL